MSEYKVPHTFCHVCENQTPVGSDRDICYVHDGPRNEKHAVTNDAGETLKSTNDTLKERGNRYGEFENHANLSQNMKNMFNKHVVEYGQPELFTATIIEAVEMIFHKLARVANGDPQYDDNFRDIAGYAELVVKDLNSET